MGYVFDPMKAVKREVRRVAVERLDDAIELLDAVIAGSADVETAVHDVRKRCKEDAGSPDWLNQRSETSSDRFDRSAGMIESSTPATCSTRPGTGQRGGNSPAESTRSPTA